MKSGFSVFSVGETKEGSKNRLAYDGGGMPLDAKATSKLLVLYCVLRAVWFVEAKGTSFGFPALMPSFLMDLFAYLIWD